MNPTEASGAELAARMFDQVLAPLAEAKRRAGAAPYFPSQRDPSLSSYFVDPSTPSMVASDFAFPGGGSATRLIEALVTYWTAEGETGLAAAGPDLVAIAHTLEAASSEGDGSVDIFCYTLF